jgi:glycosyltransferase involved in cell wall biosynthesis
VAATILIDAIAMSHPQPGGYRTYTTNLVRHLQLVDQRNEYLVAVDRPIDWTPGARWQVQVVDRRGSVGVIWREQRAIPRLAAQRGVDLLHAPAATAPLAGSTPQVLTLYDTIEFSEPLPSPRQAKRWAMRVYSRSVQKRAAQRARHILTISHYSKAQIASFFRVPESRITVTHLAASPVFAACDRKQACEEAARRWSVCDHVMGMASAARRKNVEAILQAYGLLAEDVRARHPLALLCTHPGLQAHVLALARQSGLGDQVRLLENVSDADLALLYSAASVFVFPSLEEGFGLPPLEAMACGAPVVASNTSSLPEVVGEAGLLVAPTDPAAIAEAIHRVLADPRVAEELRSRGLARSASFSWRKTAQQTLAVYEGLLRL